MIKFERKLTFRPFEVFVHIKSIEMCIVKKEIKYQPQDGSRNTKVLKVGEQYQYDFIITDLGKENVKWFLRNEYIEVKRSILYKIYKLCRKNFFKLLGIFVSSIGILAGLFTILDSKTFKLFF